MNGCLLSCLAVSLQLVPTSLVVAAVALVAVGRLLVVDRLRLLQDAVEMIDFWSANELVS